MVEKEKRQSLVLVTCGPLFALHKLSSTYASDPLNALLTDRKKARRMPRFALSVCDHCVSVPYSI